MRYCLPLTVLACAVLVAGCERQSDLMPLKVGRSTTYVVTHGLQRNVEPIKVARRIPVAGVNGYELTGAMGTSRLAWKDGVLVASQTATGWFQPPIPLLAADGANQTWEGKVTSMGRTSQAKAKLTQEAAKLEVGTKQVSTTKATLTITMPRGTIEVTSWYEEGVGLVQQEQRTLDNLVVRLEMLGTPKD